MSDQWRVRHPGIGILIYGSEQEARVAAGTAGEVLPPLVVCVCGSVHISGEVVTHPIITEATMADTLRARSCPTCRSIGEPRIVDRTLGSNEPMYCQDLWHIEVRDPAEPPHDDEIRPAELLEATARILADQFGGTWLGYRVVADRVLAAVLAVHRKQVLSEAEAAVSALDDRYHQDLTLDSPADTAAYWAGKAAVADAARIVHNLERLRQVE